MRLTDNQSRAAAVNELVGEDLPGCESSYETSIIMLEALLEPITPPESSDTEVSGDRLDEEDRLTIEKCNFICRQSNNSHPEYT